MVRLGSPFFNTKGGDTLYPKNIYKMILDERLSKYSMPFFHRDDVLAQIYFNKDLKKLTLMDRKKNTFMVIDVEKQILYYDKTSAAKMIGQILTSALPLLVVVGCSGPESISENLYNVRAVMAGVNCHHAWEMPQKRLEQCLVSESSVDITEGDELNYDQVDKIKRLRGLRDLS